jgi:branched-subunit amino acid aminotransferase/4-amino-4-deoxychorismate lyase
MRRFVGLVDGEPADGLPLTDSTVLRGDGVFEAIRAYGGRCFRLDDHLDRLERSAASLRLPVPERALLAGWVEQAGRLAGDCIVRVVLTRGSAAPGTPGEPHCVVLTHPVPVAPSTLSLLPLKAPWHPGGRAWELAGAKTVSYAPNLAASRLAAEKGHDDALLLSDEEVVLEGPTFSVGWVRRGTVSAPPLMLGVLDSITRRVVSELADVEDEVMTVDGLAAVDEVFAMSTVKEVVPVTVVGELLIEPGPLTNELAQRLRRAATGESAH